MEERTVRKCPFCGEWFNTTNTIMAKHFLIYHSDKLTFVERLYLDLVWLGAI